jgi:hypothetical protein
VVAAVIAYLVTVLYLAPAPAGQTEPQTTLAAVQRQMQADALRRTGGRVVGACAEVKQ